MALPSDVVRHPPYSYVGMLTYAIHSSPEKQMTISHIREFLTARFPTVFPPNSPKLKGNVSYQLTFNKCFVKTDHRPSSVTGRGRECYWRVDLSLVAERAFLRRVYQTVNIGTWPDELHQYLGVPKIQLPAIRHEDQTTKRPDNSGHKLVNAAPAQGYIPEEPSCKRRRVDLSFGVDRILSDSFGRRSYASVVTYCVDSDHALPVPLDLSIKRPTLSTSFVDFPSIHFSEDSPHSFGYSGDHSSFASESSIEFPRCEGSVFSENLQVMNSTRVDSDVSLDAPDFPFSPIEPELRSDDIIEGSLCLFDMVGSQLTPNDTEISPSDVADDIGNIVPSLRQNDISPLEDLLAYMNTVDIHSVSFSDFADDDFRVCV